MVAQMILVHLVGVRIPAGELFYAQFNRLGQHQSQWILMKDAALDKDPQSIIFKVFIAVG